MGFGATIVKNLVANDDASMQDKLTALISSNIVKIIENPCRLPAVQVIIHAWCWNPVKIRRFIARLPLFEDGTARRNAAGLYQRHL